jgi:hypothetical protein
VWNKEKINQPVGFNSYLTNRNTTFMTYNLIHLASILRANKGNPNYGDSRTEWDDGRPWEFEI